MGLIIDLLFPRTDSVVFAEVAIAVPLLAAFVVRSWNRSNDLRLFSIGLLVFTVAFFAARTLH